MKMGYQSWRLTTAHTLILETLSSATFAAVPASHTLLCHPSLAHRAGRALCVEHSHSSVCILSVAVYMCTCALCVPTGNMCSALLLGAWRYEASVTLPPSMGTMKSTQQIVQCTKKAINTFLLMVQEQVLHKIPLNQMICSRKVM